MRITIMATIILTVLNAHANVEQATAQISTDNFPRILNRAELDNNRSALTENIQNHCPFPSAFTLQNHHSSPGRYCKRIACTAEANTDSNWHIECIDERVEYSDNPPTDLNCSYSNANQRVVSCSDGKVYELNSAATSDTEINKNVEGAVPTLDKLRQSGSVQE